MKTSLPRLTAFCLLGFPLLLPLTAPAADADAVVIKPAPENGDPAAQEELAQARAENRRLAAELAFAQAARDDFKTKLASSQSAVELLTSKNQQLESDLAGAQTRLAASQHNESTLRDQLAAAKNTPAPSALDPSAKLAETENKLATTLHSYSQLEAENDKLKASAADVDRLNHDLKQAQDEKAALEAKLAAAPAQPSPDVATKLAETEDKLSTTLRSFSLLQAENDKLKSEAADTAKLDEELKALREEKASLEAKLAAASAPAPTPAAASSDAESKLETALRSYSLLQAENDRLKAEAAQAAASAQASASKSASESATQISALFDELRQTKAQLTALSAENAELKTRLAVSGPPPGSTLASPSRPGTHATASAPAVAATPEPAPAPRQHVVAPGDTLAKISRQYYGTPNRWDEIQRANPDVIKNENNLPIGATLRIP